MPALELGDGRVIGQSSAILEWLEECHPDPPLLPDDPEDRALVRMMTAIVGCDIHPINNLRVLNALRTDFGADDAAVSAWIGAWIEQGFEALEKLIEHHGRGFAFGNSPTLADCYLVPQVYSAERFSVDLNHWPCLVAASRNAGALSAFDMAHQNHQPDAG